MRASPSTPCTRFSLRSFASADWYSISSWLLAEGIPYADQCFNDELWIMEVDGQRAGMFSLRYEGLCGYISHFIVAPPFRSILTARALARLMVSKMIQYGQLWVTSVSVEKPYLETFLRHYFKAKAYAVLDGQRYFTLEVPHG